MGFLVGRTYSLTFEGSALDGAEIKIRSTSVGTTLRLRAMNLDDAEETAKLLEQHLISWNLEKEVNAEDGSTSRMPIGTDAASILADLEEPVLAKIILEWYRAAAGISAPLDPPSSDGQPSVEDSIPIQDSL